ncbi:MAG: hypothetical protein VKJ64_13995 [Leptolyngbyaceae bacterium]|nr:hypothetical protein [Leptolyngbyaceae bacterium]
MKFNAEFFMSLLHVSGSKTHSTPMPPLTKLLHLNPTKILAEIDDAQWSRAVSRLTSFNFQGLKTVIEQVAFVVVVLAVLGLLIFNGILWFNPELRDTIIVRHYTEQPQTYSSPGYNESTGQAAPVSFSQRLYTP